MMGILYLGSKSCLLMLLFDSDIVRMKLLLLLFSTMVFILKI